MLQQYVNQEFPGIQGGFRKGRGTRDQIANICWIIEKNSREFQKNIALLTTPKSVTVNHNKLWNILKEMGLSDHITCLLRNLYAGQEATVRTGDGTSDRFKIGKGVCQGCILSPCLFNLYVDYIMRNAGMNESQAGSRLLGEISITSDIQMTPSLWQKVKKNYEVKEESKKVGLKLNIQKMKIMASGPITSWEIDGETVETVRLYFLGLQNHCRW